VTQEPIGGGGAPDGGATDTHVPHETLMRYIDGELPPEERKRVDAALAVSTELRRELALYRTLHEDLAGISFDRRQLRDSVWSRVNRRLARPIGWLLVAAGALGWSAHVVYVYFTSTVSPLEKVATSAVVIGVLLLLATVIYDRYREYLTDPYRHVER
jgi:anti-sigma factor RsiW